MLTYRPATLDDAELAVDLMTAANPTWIQDPAVIRHRWEHPRTGFSVGRFIAGSRARPVAFVAWMHGPWASVSDRHCEVEVWLIRDELDLGLLRDMWTWVGDLAIAEGSRLLLAYCGEDEPEMLESLASLGYTRERLEKLWELDLLKHASRLKDEALAERRTMSDQGIVMTTVEAWKDPDKMRKLYELDWHTRQDIPTSLPILVEPFEDFERRTKAPDRRPDRTWVALDKERPVAMTYLKFPPVRGTVWTGYTCSDPRYRGRGLARAIKLQSLVQAIELGVPVVRTDNDGENAPMLHINERLGYERRPGFVEHHKRVENKDA